MNTKTTQELARELADALELRHRLVELDESPILDLKYSFPHCGGLVVKTLSIPQKYRAQVPSAIRAEIDKEAANIKKQLQEALASE